jgi:hypothetical protein
MIVGLVELALIVAVLGLLIFGAAAFWRTLQGAPDGPPRLPNRARAELAAAIAQARWAPAHDEVDGSTRVLVRRAYTGLDGRPVVLEDRVLETFPAEDPAWEARFTEAMARARFRCSYLNTEEAH